MRLNEFARTVKAMRSAQVKYFGERSQGNLIKAKDWERRVDMAIVEGIEADESHTPTLPIELPMEREDIKGESDNEKTN